MLCYYTPTTITTTTTLFHITTTTAHVHVHVDLKSIKSSDEFTFDLLSHRRLKRDAEEDPLKYKKVSTKKPTQPIKPKPTSAVPYKAPSPIQASSSNDESHSVPTLSQSEVNSHAITPTETSIIPPEDATLPPNSNTTVSNNIFSRI